MVFAFISCNDAPYEEHEHLYGDWMSDETSHWKECSCGEKSEVGEHDFVLDLKKETKTCSVCGYEAKLVATEIKDEASLIEAATNGSGLYVLSDNIKLTKQLNISAAITIDGNGKTITRETPTQDETVGEKAIILISSNDVTLRNLTVSGTGVQEKWNDGEFGIKVFDATGVVLDGVTVTKTNAGIQVNSSDVTVKGDITVSGNTFGGIGVDMASTSDKKGKLTLDSSANIISTDENVPAIWLESTDKAEIVGAEKLESFTNERSQIYYLTENQVGKEVDQRVWDGTAVNTDWYKAEGTEYSINTASQFAGLAKLVNDGNSFEGKIVRLSSDLDLSEHEWTPIGNGKRSGKGIDNGSRYFSGTFDGQHHSIYGLSITTSNVAEDDCLGLFGVVKKGKILNFDLKNSKIDRDACENVGLAVGLAVEDSWIEGITTDKASSVSAMGAGGIVGRMTVSGTIAKCENHASVTSSKQGAGGIVCKAYYSEENKLISISDCKNFGDVKDTKNSYVGGIVSFCAGEISNCENSGSVSGTASSIGGIVGEITMYGSVRNCVNSGAISSQATSEDAYGLGGIVGWIRYNQSQSSYTRSSIIEVTGNKNHASIAGNSTGVGGIVGMVFSVAIVDGNENYAPSLSGKQFVSGIAGGHQIIEGNLFNDDVNVAKTTFKNNSSGTASEAITGSCKSTIVYINNSAKIPSENISGNTPENVGIN